MQQRIDLALELEERLASAVCAENKALIFARQLFARLRQVDPAQLVELDVAVLVRKVACENVEHTRQDHGAHDGRILAERVDDGDGIAKRRIRRDADGVKAGGGDERVGDDLVKAEAARHGARRVFELRFLAVAAARRCAAHERGGDVVVAVVARDLLGNVRHAAQVGTPRWYLDETVLDLDLLAAQIVDHVRAGDIRAEQGVDLVLLQREGDGLRDVVDDVDHAVQHLARAEQLHELARAVHGGDGEHRVDVLFKFRGRVGAHTERQRRLADGRAEEVGGLEHHVHRVRHDLTVFAAHDARQTHGLFLVRDHEHIRLQIADVAVERGERFILARAAHDDLAAVYIAVVKGVHRLTVFDHHIVRDVHDVVDGADARRAQALAHPLGAGRDPDIAHHAGRIPQAQVVRLHVHVQKLRQAALAAALHDRLMVAHGYVERRRRLTRKTQQRVAVGAVVRDLKFHDGVVVADDLVDVLSDGAVLIV